LLQGPYGSNKAGVDTGMGSYRDMVIDHMAVLRDLPAPEEIFQMAGRKGFMVYDSLCHFFYFNAVCHPISDDYNPFRIFHINRL
jgi:hypothetical protein